MIVSCTYRYMRAWEQGRWPNSDISSSSSLPASYTRTYLKHPWRSRSEPTIMRNWMELNSESMESTLTRLSSVTHRCDAHRCLRFVFAYSSNIESSGQHRRIHFLINEFSNHSRLWLITAVRITSPTSESEWEDKFNWNSFKDLRWQEAWKIWKISQLHGWLVGNEEFARWWKREKSSLIF